MNIRSSIADFHDKINANYSKKQQIGTKTLSCFLQRSPQIIFAITIKY